MPILLDLGHGAALAVMKYKCRHELVETRKTARSPSRLRIGIACLQRPTEPRPSGSGGLAEFFNKLVGRRRVPGSYSSANHRSLKQKLQTQLHQARRRRLQNAAEARRGKIRHWQREIGVVSQVEAFRSELQPPCVAKYATSEVH